MGQVIFSSNLEIASIFAMSHEVFLYRTLILTYFISYRSEMCWIYSDNWGLDLHAATCKSVCDPCCKQ